VRHSSRLIFGTKSLIFCSVRPLQTFDLRSRKVSGRDQIAYDGKHLIDGVAFGRPFFRRADRPAISIPPRKRRRVLYASDDEDDSIGKVINDKQVALRANFVNVDEDEDENSQEDEDYVLADEDESTLENEALDLQKDFEPMQAGDEDRHNKAPKRQLRPSRLHEPQRTITRSQRNVQGLGLDAQGVIKLVDEKGHPFPGAYSNTLLDYYATDEASPDTVQLPASKRRKRAKGGLGGSTELGKSRVDTSNSNKRRSSSQNSKSVRFKPPGYEVSGGNFADEEENSLDEDFTPDRAGVSDEESDKENLEPGVLPSDSSTVTSVSESESSDTQSSVSSSSLSSSSSDEDSSDSEPEEASSQLKSHQLEKAFGKNPEAKPSSQYTSPNQQERQTAPAKIVKPGHGQVRTKKRNQRRRAQKKAAALQALGLSPRKQSPKIGNRGQDGGLVSSMLKAAVIPHRKVNEADSFEARSQELLDSFEARRKELLNSIAAGGVELDVPEPPRSSKSTEDTATKKDSVIHADPHDQASTPHNAIVSHLSNQPASEPSQQRAKLDLASSRRLLFGSLGLRTPKTKDEEHTLREKLTKQAKPAVVPVSFQTDEGGLRFGDATTQMQEEIGDDDSWKRKVILKAVECCYDGLELSVPPFPFMQRWDPQQQGGSKARKKGGKSKKRKRNQSQYYEKGGGEYGTQESVHLEQGHVNDMLNPDDREPEQIASYAQPKSDEIDGAVNDQLMRDANGISATAPGSVEGPDDLQVLPEDFSSMSALAKEVALPGAIIAFRQLEMSQSTNWQPKISDYRTATVLDINENEALQLRLSERDRKHDDKTYDEETGERIYAKFEMPEFDDEAAAEDDGFAEIMFVDLIEPKLLQATKSQSKATSEQHGTDVVQDQRDTRTQNAETAHPPEARGSGKAQELDKARANDDHVEVDDEVRKEIIQLMKDVGFRSSIGSEAARAEEMAKDGDSPSLKELETLNEAHTHVRNAGSSSPRFNGLGSSPAAEEASRVGPSSPPRQSSILREAGTPTGDVVGQGRAVDEMHGEEPNKGRDAKDEVKNESASPDRDEQQPAGNANENSPNTVRHKLRKQLQSLFGPLSPSVAGSPIEQPIDTSPKSAKKSVGGLDGALSDDDFPSLDTVLSTARSSFEMAAPKQNGKQRLSSPHKKEPTALPSPQATPHAGLTNGAAAHTSISRSSQLPAGSQVVDLTLSSDPVDPIDDDDDDDGDGEYHDGVDLPKGPGWVKKRNLRSETSSKALGKRPYRAAVRINRSL